MLALTRALRARLGSRRPLRFLFRFCRQKERISFLKEEGRRSKIRCVEHHFRDVTKMVIIGSGGERKIKEEGRRSKIRCIVSLHARARRREKVTAKKKLAVTSIGEGVTAPSPLAGVLFALTSRASPSWFLRCPARPLSPKKRFKKYASPKQFFPHALAGSF